MIRALARVLQILKPKYLRESAMPVFAHQVFGAVAGEGIAFLIYLSKF